MIDKDELRKKLSKKSEDFILGYLEGYKACQNDEQNECEEIEQSTLYEAA